MSAPEERVPRRRGFERPNQRWVCGWAAEGKPCPVGPDGRGGCPAAGEALCQPQRHGDRWLCTRPVQFGGSCDEGPRPDGSCCRPEPDHPVCQPRLSLRARRRRVTACCSTFAVGLLALLLGGPWGWRFISPGPLSRAHGSASLLAGVPRDHQGAVAWSVGCDSCHQPAAMGVALRPVTDGACLSCHAGEAHHPRRSIAAVAEFGGGHPMAHDCVSCHSEHRGPDHDLRRVRDRNCIECHADVSAWRRTVAEVIPGLATYPPMPALEPPIDRLGQMARTITSFAGDHPEFGVVADPQRTDESWLRFEHHSHLLDSTRMREDLERLKSTLGAAAPAYVSEGLDGALALACTACHQQDPAGRFMLPISFAAHCQSCHGGSDLSYEGHDVPHGSAANLMLAHLLEQRLVEKIGKPQAEEAPEEPSGGGVRRRGSRAAPGPLDPETERRRLAQDIQRAVTSQCAKCHRDTAGERPDDISTIRPPTVPERWMVRSTFSHKAHLFMDCLDCHARAMADPVKELLELPSGLSRWSGRTREIMLPGIESCRACHAPRRGGVVEAAHDCVTCHQYHAPALPPGVRTALTRGSAPGAKDR